MRNEDAIKADMTKLEMDPKVREYIKLLKELDDKREYDKEEAEKKRLLQLQQKQAQKNTNVSKFLTGLKAIVLTILNSLTIPDKDDAWITEYPEYYGDIEMDKSALEAYFESYSTDEYDYFAVIAVNVLLRVVHNDTIYVSMHTDDDHYCDDLIEFKYDGSFSNIISENIIDKELLNLL